MEPREAAAMLLSLGERPRQPHRTHMGIDAREEK
jgi:hypothetical protein